MLEDEIWFTKIISLQSSIPILFQCKKTKIEMPFTMDENQIRLFYETVYPKWIDNEKYYLISRRSWGLGKYMCLYVNQSGNEFIIESTP